MKTWTFLLLAALPTCAFAQDQAIQRAVIQRDQQSDAFRLQLQQWQQRIAVPPSELPRQQAIDARQIVERQRLDEVSERQLRDVKPEAPVELRPYERQSSEAERRPFVTPSAP